MASLLRIAAIPSWICLLLFNSCVSSQAKAGEKNYITPAETKSPDGRYGVMVPVFSFEDQGTEKRRNQVVDLHSGKVVAVIASDNPAYDRTLNHHGMGQARWSKDGSLLLWYVGGKWSPDLVALVKLEKGRAKWQLDVLTTGQQALLKRTRKAAPEKYEAAKIENAGDRSAYPDGFTVDVTTDGEKGRTVALPLVVHVDLTANPKAIADFPRNLDSYLDGVVNEDGIFVVKSFHLGPRKGKDW